MLKPNHVLLLIKRLLIWVYIGVMVREARSRCMVSFDSFDFVHSTKKYNNVAHTIADYCL
jgi:hypothetical protein